MTSHLQGGENQLIFGDKAEVRCWVSLFQALEDRCGVGSTPAGALPEAPRRSAGCHTPALTWFLISPSS